MNLINILLAIFAFTACTPETVNTPDEKLVCTPTSINIDYQESVSSIDISASREWQAYSDNDWIKCNPSGSVNTSGTVTVNIAANNSMSAREGAVVIKAGSSRATISVVQQAKPISDIVPPEGYTLIWNDEFDEGDSPNSDWWYETGGGGWGNGELQNYVSGSVNGEKLAVISDGVLNIIAKKINGTVYSIRMNTVKSWTYGYFEARLKLPVGKGTWPAFWMMPKNFSTWPGDGEIDIMEHVGYRPNWVSTSIHCKSYNHLNGTQRTAEKYIETAQSEFHVYALEWTENYIKGYIDGVNYFTFTNDKANNYDTWPFYNPFFLKLNLAWGGSWGGAQGIDESSLPATYLIDYVRVFQKK